MWLGFQHFIPVLGQGPSATWMTDYVVDKGKSWNFVELEKNGKETRIAVFLSLLFLQCKIGKGLDMANYL